MSLFDSLTELVLVQIWGRFCKLGAKSTSARCRIVRIEFYVENYVKKDVRSADSQHLPEESASHPSLLCRDAIGVARGVFALVVLMIQPSDRRKILQEPRTHA